MERSDMTERAGAPFCSPLSHRALTPLCQLSRRESQVYARGQAEENLVVR